MSVQPKVSVIIPVFNAAGYLRGCLDAVCRQTLDIEVICIDDCSVDNSLDILKEYAEKYDFIRILQQQENMGAGPARNAGLEAARGEYIAFMDADDTYPDDGALQRLYEAASQNGALVSGGGLLCLAEDGTIAEKDGDEKYSFEESGWVAYKDRQQSFFYQCFIFSRKMLRENHITFPPYLRFQDPPFFIRAMVTAENFYAVNEPVYVYRNDIRHVNWTDRKVNDYLKGAGDVLELSRKHRLEKPYFQTLHRLLNNKYYLGIFEESLLRGNDEILNFYRTVFRDMDHELLGDLAGELDLRYGEVMAAARLNRNMCLNHRPLDLQQPNKNAVLPRVSVIIPVYNMEKYLGQCMESIVCQTLKDIEIICVNDGSTDNSAEILDGFAEKHENIFVYHQPNGGLSAARNTGIQHAHGEYVYFMDSDDYLELTALEKLYETAKKDQLDILYFAGESFFESPEDAQSKSGQFFIDAYKRNAEYSGVMRGADMLVAQHKNKDYYTSVCIQFFRTQFIRENDLGFYEGILHEDNLFTLSAMVMAQRVRCISDIYFHRRVRQGSIMSTPIGYRNILGYYLTVMEAGKLYMNAGLDRQQSGAFQSRLKRLIKNNVGTKWKNLHRAEQVLFRASLSAAERMQFELFVLPLIEYGDKVSQDARTAAAEYKSQRKQLAREIKAKDKKIEELKEKNGTLRQERNELRQQIKALKQSRSWKIGCMITWIPRKAHDAIRGKRTKK